MKLDARCRCSGQTQWADGGRGLNGFAFAHIMTALCSVGLQQLIKSMCDLTSWRNGTQSGVDS